MTTIVTFDITANQNHPAIEQALAHMAAHDTDHASTRNNVGFNSRETEFGCSLAQQASTRRLSDKQHELACKLLWRYNNTQIAPADIKLPVLGDLQAWLRERERLHPYKPTATILPPATFSSMGRVYLHNEQLTVHMPKNYWDWVPKIKTIEVSGHVVAKYDGTTKLWQLPLDWLDALQQVLPTTHFDYTPEVLASKAEQEKRRKLAALELEIRKEAQQARVNKLLKVARLDEPLANGWLLQQHQKEAVQFVFEHERVIIGDQMGLGKAQPLTTNVLTPKGYRQMGSLKVGDLVIGSDGKPTPITGVYPQGIKPVYRVFMNDGSSVECCEDHLWSVQTAAQKRRGSGFKTKSLKQLLSEGLQFNGVSKNTKNYIPMVKPVEFVEEDLPLHPYIIGVLLGDGCLSVNRVAWDKPDAWLAEKVASLLPDSVKVNQLSEKLYSITRLGVTGENYALNQLRDLGLMGCTAHTKFIPDVYKYSSVESRISLLQGLLDTDGSTSNNTVEYSSSSEQLLDDVQFLVESLGGVAYKSSRIPRYTYKGEKLEGARSYRVTISLPADILPFSTPIKADKYTPRTKYQPVRGIKSAVYVGEKECQCISVAAEDHLYVTEHCIVTHNTISALKAAAAYQQAFGCDIICLVPVTLIDNWYKEASYIGCTIKAMGQTAGRIPKPQDITKKFVLIVDECHAFKNIGSQRTKAYMALAESPHLVVNICMSGTPVKNGSPSDIYPILKSLKHPVAENKKRFFDRYGSASEGYLRELHQILTVEQPVMIRRTKEQVLNLPMFTRQIIEGVLTPYAQSVYDAKFKELQVEYNRRVAEDEISSTGWELVMLNHLRHAGSVAKIDTVVDLALEFLQGVDGLAGEQVVIFTVFKDTAFEIQQRLQRQGFVVDVLSGDTKQSDRDPMVQRFQTKQTDAIVCMSQAGGVGITLTSASKVIMADRDWNLHSQCESRVDRLGQTKPTTAYWVRYTICDSWIDNKLIEKENTSDLILQGYSTGIDGVNWSEEARNLLAAVFNGEYKLLADDEDSLPDYDEEF